MFGMYDRIRCSPCPIVIEASGMVMSAASIIFQAADVRRIHWRATMMIHYGRAGYVGDPRELDSYAKESRRVTRVMHDIYLERIRQRHPKFTLKQLEKMMSVDRWIPAHEVVELGLADEIIPYPEKA